MPASTGTFPDPPPMKNTQWARVPADVRRELSDGFAAIARKCWQLKFPQFLRMPATVANFHALHATVRNEILTGFLGASEDLVCRYFPWTSGGLPPFFFGVDVSDPVRPGVMFSVPAFSHDCDDCRFLGMLDPPDGVGDLYVCNKQGYRTVIARWSDEPSDYASGPPRLVSSEAWARAAIQRLEFVGAPR